MTMESKKKSVLICLPYAGGNKYSFRMFENYAPRSLQLVTIEYPGRGHRSQEALLYDSETLVEDIFKSIKGMALNEVTYAIYGHSMGALLAWLICKRILQDNYHLPRHLFISGTMGPSAATRADLIRHTLNKDDFMKEVRGLNGTSDELFHNSELFEYFEPILRADFKVSETFSYVEEPPIDIPMTVMTGRDEDLTAADIQCWQKESTLPIDFRRFPGDHFFINRHASTVLEIVSKKILSISNRSYYE